MKDSSPTQPALGFKEGRDTRIYTKLYTHAGFAVLDLALVIHSMIQCLSKTTHIFHPFTPNDSESVAPLDPLLRALDDDSSNLGLCVMAKYPPHLRSDKNLKGCLGYHMFCCIISPVQHIHNRTSSINPFHSVQASAGLGSMKIKMDVSRARSRLICLFHLHPT